VHRTNDDTIAPTPPRANFVSQLMRACCRNRRNYRSARNVRSKNAILDGEAAELKWLVQNIRHAVAC
jgi:hypothetical protein